ncbi:TRAP transporter substrate-binding protein [Pelagibacterium nitratireducens]|uniref:TRAP transporter substrate-binding protein n=1 Tax=Pelagibacterium nitratireducens TaxID=1046114 RepID=A0ABZ2I0J5_9HYPH
MNYLGWIKGAALAGVATIALTAGSAQAQTVWRINVSMPQDGHHGIAIDTFAEEVERLTEGRYVIETFYAGSLGGERESIEGVQLGTLELTFTSTGPVPNFVPELSILDIPFLFRDYEHARGVLDSEIGDELLGRFESHGIKGLAWADNGFRHMTNDIRPIESPEDLDGLKLRTMESPVHIAAYREFGILPTPMAFPEVFAALQQGVVDGQENPLSVIESNNFDEVQQYLSMTGHVFSPCVFLMNLDLWNGLSDEDQAHFVEAAQAGTAANRARVDEDEATAIETMRADGMEILEDIDRDAFVAALSEVNAQFAEEFGAEEVQAIRDWQPE